MAGAEVLGEPNGAGDVDRGRAAEAEAFFLYQVEDVGQRFGIADLVAEVGREAFEVRGDAALADALGDR